MSPSLDTTCHINPLFAFPLDGRPKLANPLASSTCIISSQPQPMGPMDSQQATSPLGSSRAAIQHQAQRSANILATLQHLTKKRDELRALDRHLFSLMSDCLLQLRLCSNGCPEVEQAIENFYLESQNFTSNQLPSWPSSPDSKPTPSSPTGSPSLGDLDRACLLKQPAALDQQAVDLRLAMDRSRPQQSQFPTVDLSLAGSKLADAQDLLPSSGLSRLGPKPECEHTTARRSPDNAHLDYVNVKKRRLLNRLDDGSPGLDPIKSFDEQDFDHLKRKSPTRAGETALFGLPQQQPTSVTLMAEQLCSNQCQLDLKSNLQLPARANNQHQTPPTSPSIIQQTKNLNLNQASLVPTSMNPVARLGAPLANLAGTFAGDNLKFTTSLPMSSITWLDLARQQSIFEQSLAADKTHPGVLQTGPICAPQIQYDAIDYLHRLQTTAQTYNQQYSQPTNFLSQQLGQLSGLNCIPQQQPFVFQTTDESTHDRQQAMVRLDEQRHQLHQDVLPMGGISNDTPSPSALYSTINYTIDSSHLKPSNLDTKIVVHDGADQQQHRQLIQKLAFRCHVCGSGFEDRHRLQQHLSIHLNLHPSWFEERTIKETMAQYESRRGDYLCTKCQFRFDTTAEFDRHMQQLHGDKPHHCEVCRNQDNKQVSFRFFRQLLTHLRSHCFLYSCRFVPECKQTANRKDYLKLHILKHHLNNKLPEQYTICCH